MQVLLLTEIVVKVDMEFLLATKSSSILTEPGIRARLLGKNSPKAA